MNIHYGSLGFLNACNNPNSHDWATTEGGGEAQNENQTEKMLRNEEVEGRRF